MRPLETPAIQKGWIGFSETPGRNPHPDTISVFTAGLALVVAVGRDLKKGFLLMPALEYIARNWPYWNRTGGKRHIIPMEGAACARVLTAAVA